MLMNKTIKSPSTNLPVSLNYLHVLIDVFIFHSIPYHFFFPGKRKKHDWNGKQFDFQCEEIANNFSGTWIISLSGKRGKKGTAANYWRKAGDRKRDFLMASEWVTEGDATGTMGDRCPLIGTDQRRFPPFVGSLLFLF
ncbi:hypothetical protein CEXT_507951 [Caerostris extrusa]|uniref:LAGLIDADG homing endonuclease n=1 Tax=Caerostris extrusa TaxID=172846 RepID=A0AAV4XZQ1_CAEEX|nr:hypothetical protein CEXT_507951 [Caerostris extrusa]